MAYVKIMVHAVWGTKHKEPYLTKEIRPQVISHIKENAKSKEIFIDRLNGFNDHLHKSMRNLSVNTILKVMANAVVYFRFFSPEQIKKEQ